MEEEAEEDLEMKEEFYFATHITCLKHNTGTDDDDNVFYSSTVTNTELFKILNHLTLNGHFSGRTAPLTYRCCIFLIIQQIYALNILNMLRTLRFFLFKLLFIS
jgi:hypothetical protein